MDISIITQGLSDALSLEILLYVALGVFIGQLVGAIPGLSGPLALAIAVPVTYYLGTLPAIAFLIGVNKGGTVGGAVSAILLNTPGSPEATATAFDGYPLAKKGKPLKALKMALYASVSGDTFSDLVLILVSAPLALVAIKMGPAEISGVVILALSIIAGLVGKSVIKGLIAACFGIFISTIGIDPESGIPRLDFGIVELQAGLPLIAVAIGVLALGEVIRQLETSNKESSDTLTLAAASPADRRVSWAEYRTCLRTITRSAVIGTAIGAIPGLGASVAAFLGYGAARRASKQPDSFGQGNIEGIAAAEAANSAVVGANLIPLLTLGIPGNVAAALILGAFLIHGVAPGPLLFEQQGRLIYGLFGAMVLANICNLVIGNLGLRLFALIVRAPSSIVLSMVVLLCMTGALIRGGLYALIVMLAFGVIGYLMRKLGFSIVPFIIGFVLGPMFELSLRQTVNLADGDIGYLLDRPVALLLLVLAGVMIVRFSLLRRKKTS